MNNKLMNIICSLMYLIRAAKSFISSYRFSYKKRESGIICILGTGPSFKDDSDSLLARSSNVCYFALNDFGTTELYHKFQPTFYTIVDPCYWMRKEDCNERDFDLREALFDRINKETTWKMTLFVPWVAYKTNVIANYIKNNNVTIVPFNYLNYYPTYSKYYNKILEYNIGVVPVGNVMGAAIYLSINLGFDEIRLYGADHSWTRDLRVNNLNQVCTIKRHFFDEEEELIPWRKSNREIFRMSEVLYSLQRHFAGYEYLEWYAKTHNVRVINCTKDSFIDSFEKI